MKLDRVTITGADDSTDHDELFRLSERYPFVEWGILLSRSSEGRSRFPSLAWIERLMELDRNASLRLSGHLCGSWVRDLCEGRATFLADRPALRSSFQRIQLNFHAIVHGVQLAPFVAALSEWDRPEYIFQLDDVNNDILDIARGAGVRAVPLFDLSGGAGILPFWWPKPNGDYCGYAGGLSPDNLKEQLHWIHQATGDSRIWIDVETHVRSHGDALFDLAKVERFLRIAESYVWTFNDEVREAGPTGA